MLIETKILTKDTETIQGLLDGSQKRYGSVIREKSTSRNVRFLVESPGFTKQLMKVVSSPLLGKGKALAKDIIGHNIPISKLPGMSQQFSGIEQTLSSVLQIGQIAAGASILNLGVSIIGFAYMGYKLHQVQNSLEQIQRSMDAGFNRIEDRLDKLSGQLAYLHLLVQDSRQKQQHLAQAISNIHRTILIKEITDLASEILNVDRFPNDSKVQAIRVASGARLFLSNQALQSNPEFEAEVMLNSDISIQGWAAATAAEANLLLEIGEFQEAIELLEFEVPKFRNVAEKWADNLLYDQHPQMATAYRFTNSHFGEHISLERAERIVDISQSDRSLSSQRIERKKDEIEVEFLMNYASQDYDQAWLYRQVAIAEYLDTLSELSARLDSLRSFAVMCESRNIENSKEILPDTDDEPGLYLLS